MLNWMKVPKLSSERFMVLASEFIVLAFTTIMMVHTASVASEVFTGKQEMNWQGIAYAVGVELAMVFYGFAISHSPSRGYTAMIVLCMVLAISTSVYCQLYYILESGTSIDPYWNSYFEKAIDFLPIYLAFSLGVILFSVTLSMVVLSNTKVKAYTADGVKTYTKDELEVVKLREAASTRSKRGNKGSEWSYPTKTGMVEVESPDELVERFGSYVNKSYGKRFLEQQKEAILNWLHNTDSGQYILTNTNFNLELE